MIESIRALLATLYRLLPVHVTDDDLRGLDADTREALPANFSAVAVNGFFFPTAGRIVAASLLLTWFVSELTESAFWVGLIIPIQYGLALVGQPFIADWLAGKSHRKRYYTYQALLRGALWAGLGVAALALGSGQPTVLLVIFFAVVIVDAVAAGLGNIAFSDTLASAIPPRLRGRVRGWRGIFGGIVTAGVGIWMQTSLSEASGLRVYGLLFAVAGILYALGGLAFGLIRTREVEARQDKQPGLGDVLARMGDLWRHPTFRQFVAVQALLTPLVQGLPFFTLFAKQRFGLDFDALGILVVVSALTPILANFVWGRLSDARDHRFTLLASGILGLIAPVCAGLLLGQTQPGGLVIALLAVIVAVVSMASAGFDLASKNYVLALSPNEQERPFYIGVNDTAVGLPTSLLAATGLIIDLFGFVPVFAGITVFTLAAVGVGLRLPPEDALQD